MKHVAGPNSSTVLTGVHSKSDVQPNAIDLRLDRVFEFCTHSGGMFNSFHLSEGNKIHRETREIEPIDNNGMLVFCLPPGSYQIQFQNEISVGGDEAGWVITRSTLLRNGVYIVSGLYDSGYEGGMTALLVVTGGDFSIEKGTRVGQYLSFSAEALHKYDGSYGVGKEDPK